jgi:hypothetical protein
MCTLQVILLAVGAVLEFGGIVAIAFPDFLPHGRRLSRWLGHRARIVVNRVRRLLGMKPLQKIVSVEAADSVEVSGRSSALVSVSEDATPEEKIEFLLRRSREAQQAINTLSGRVKDLEKHVPRQLDQLREDMQAHVSSELAAAEEEYRPLRTAGTLALGVGLACTTVSNFV